MDDWQKKKQKSHNERMREAGHTVRGGAAGVYILEDICPYICPGETGRYGEREIMGMKYTRILVKELVEEINEVSR